MEGKKMKCHKCNMDAEWVIQSPSLAYWYCKDCKVEPIELPVLEQPLFQQQLNLFEEDGGTTLGKHVRYTTDKGWEYSPDGINWTTSERDDDSSDYFDDYDTGSF